MGLAHSAGSLTIQGLVLDQYHSPISFMACQDFGGPTGEDTLRCLVSLNLSISISSDKKNLSSDLPWNLQVCVIPSSSRYWGATFLKNVPDIFLCTARCLMAFSAVLLCQGIPSNSRKVNRQSL
jgi:hypothetical protein